MSARELPRANGGRRTGGDRTISDLTSLAVSIKETKPQEALLVLQRACAHGPQELTPDDRGEAHYQRALLLQAKGDYRAGLSAVRAARRNFLAAGLDQEAMATEIARAALLSELGDDAQALSISESILDALKPEAPAQPKSQLTMQIRAEASLTAGVALTKLGRPSLALRHFDFAANIFHALDDLSMVAHTDIRRGSAYLEMGMSHQGLAILEGASERLNAVGGTALGAELAVPMAEALLQLNDPAAAIAVLDEARRGLDASWMRADAARIQLMISNSLLHAGLVHDARMEAQDVSPLFSELEMESELARCLHLSGTAAFMLNDLTTAHSELVVAERLYADFDDRVKGKTLVRLTLSWLELSRGDTAEAARIAETLLRGTANDPDLAIVAGARLILARATQEPDLAQRHLESASHIIQSRQLNLLRLGLDIELADRQRERGDLAGAAQVLRAGLRMEAENHFAMSDANFYVAHSLVKSVAFDILIGLLLSIGTPTACAEAWQWATYMKPSRRSGAATAPNVSNTRLTHTPPDVAKELGHLSNVYDKLTFNHKTDQVAIRSAYVAARRELRRSPAEAAPNAVTSAPIVLPSIPEGPLLQFHLISGSIVAFVIREGQVYARRLPGGASELPDLLRHWRAECLRSDQQTLQPSTEVSHPSSASPALAALYQLLVEPIEDLLEGLDGSPLLIVGHRQLHDVPFGALARVGSASLLERFTLRFSTSIHAQPEESAGEGRQVDTTAAPGSLLVLSAPDHRAPDIAIEAETIAKLRPDAEIHVGDEATAPLLATRGREFDTIHIASHGMFRADNPACSALRLGDRWITAGEIANLDLRGTLVVLNACASSLGEETATTVDGLAWAFLAAGSRGVVAANWNLVDSTALEFAEHFHRHVSDGFDPVHSVQLANQDLARAHPHPSSWCAYRYTSAPSAALIDHWSGGNQEA